MNASMDYDIDIGKFSLKPHDSYYNNFILNMAKEETFAIKVIKEKNYPVLKIKNSKIIYLNRVIGEIREFIRSIESEIQLSSQKLAEAKSIKIVQEPLQTQTNKDDQIFASTKSNVMKIVIEDSCLVIPRSSRSKDIFVLMFKKLEAFIGNFTFYLSNYIKIMKQNL